MNVTDIISNLNNVFEKLFKSVEAEVYVVLDSIVCIDKNIFKIEPIKNIIDSNGIVIIANAIMFFLIIYYIFTVLISMYNGNKYENVYHLIIKLLLISVLINSSYYITEQIIDINFQITEAVESLCEDLANKEITFENLKENIINIKDFMNSDFMSLDGIIKGVISFGTVNILINFCVRYATIILLIIISPVAFCMLFSNLTKGAFYTWIKILITNLLVQIVLKVLLSIPLIYTDTNSIMYKIVLVGTIYIIYKLNNFVKELFSKFSSFDSVKNIFKGE